MPTCVRSYSKVNLGLAIGPVRPDGFHGLTTVYQTLELHDLVTVEARPASSTSICLTTNDRRVPTDSRNTAWKMVERALGRMGLAAEVSIHIEKRLPVQGGMGAGSANAAAALVGLERELGKALPGAERLRLAGEVGSDVPLFLLGGTVLGLGRGELVVPLPDLPATHCVVAVPDVGVSTPQAFRDWDSLAGENPANPTHDDKTVMYGAPSVEATMTPSVVAIKTPSPVAAGLTPARNPDRLEELSLAYASLYAQPDTSGIIQRPNGQTDDLAENTLLALVRTGVENDFERVVFPVYPFLGEIKRQLMGSGSGAAMYAALSGSGSALFGLYRFGADARAAQQRVESVGVKALVTRTLPRSVYWTGVFAE